MPYKNILYEEKERIAIVTINRPNKLNALNDETINELFDIFGKIKTDDNIWTVIITGSGDRAFVAGADVDELSQLTSNSAEEKMLKGQDLFNRIENLGKPVIAAINGFALGGGCELAMACTLRIASEGTKLGQPETSLGIMPGYGGTQRLPRLIGKGKAMELLLTGEAITAQEAHRIGLVNAIYPKDRLLSSAYELARKIISKSPLSTRAIIEVVNNGLETPFSEALKLEAKLFRILITSDDAQEGLKAFLEKRPPQFKGK
ncbi:MAG: enoyl-CoA hydratase-related protein [Planctomycetota bacterium]|nr:enoyl-CoA hydratase-related protein [Planctomycetota bacterium]MDI6787058.1 enoyl-CoA hydratase-related protein [Planctomycetota bacterium]